MLLLLLLLLLLLSLPLLLFLGGFLRLGGFAAIVIVVAVVVLTMVAIVGVGVLLRSVPTASNLLMEGLGPFEQGRRDLAPSGPRMSWVSRCCQGGRANAGALSGCSCGTSFLRDCFSTSSNSVNLKGPCIKTALPAGVT